MHRVITAASFIKANMPYGQATRENPKLGDEEALHVAESVASDEYLILDAFGASELRRMLERLSEIAVSDLLYSA